MIIVKEIMIVMMGHEINIGDDDGISTQVEASWGGPAILGRSGCDNPATAVNARVGSESVFQKLPV